VALGGRSNWPADARSTQGASSSTGSLSRGNSLVQAVEAVHTSLTGHAYRSELRRLEGSTHGRVCVLRHVQVSIYLLVTPLGKILSVNQPNLSSQTCLLRLIRRTSSWWLWRRSWRSIPRHSRWTLRKKLKSKMGIRDARKGDHLQLAQWRVKRRWSSFRCVSVKLIFEMHPLLRQKGDTCYYCVSSIMQVKETRVSFYHESGHVSYSVSHHKSQHVSFYHKCGRFSHFIYIERSVRIVHLHFVSPYKSRSQLGQYSDGARSCHVPTISFPF
jgi:hypothetical protein